MCCFSSAMTFPGCVSSDSTGYAFSNFPKQRRWDYDTRLGYISRNGTLPRHGARFPCSSLLPLHTTLGKYLSNSYVQWCQRLIAPLSAVHACSRSWDAKPSPKARWTPAYRTNENGDEAAKNGSVGSKCGFTCGV